MWAELGTVISYTVEPKDTLGSSVSIMYIEMSLFQVDKYCNILHCEVSLAYYGGVLSVSSFRGSTV